MLDISCRDSVDEPIGDHIIRLQIDVAIRILEQGQVGFAVDRVDRLPDLVGRDRQALCRVIRGRYRSGIGIQAVFEVKQFRRDDNRIVQDIARIQGILTRRIRVCEAVEDDRLIGDSPGRGTVVIPGQVIRDSAGRIVRIDSTADKPPVGNSRDLLARHVEKQHRRSIIRRRINREIACANGPRPILPDLPVGGIHVQGIQDILVAVDFQRRDKRGIEAQPVEHDILDADVLQRIIIRDLEIKGECQDIPRRIPGNTCIGLYREVLLDHQRRNFKICMLRGGIRSR